MTSLTASDPLSTLSSVGVTRVEGSTCTNNFTGGTTYFYPQTANGSVGGASWVQFQTEGFSNFFINRVAALPLELASFTGTTKSASNMLQWETLTEKNIAWHIVERSADGATWTEVGRTAGQAESYISMKYTLEDRAPLAKAYYRLRSTDFDGSENRSASVLLTRNSGDSGILNVFPSPVKDRTNIQFTSAAEEILTLRLTDLAGRQVLTKSLPAEKGFNETSLQLLDLQPGIYQISISGASFTAAPARFVKE